MKYLNIIIFASTLFFLSSCGGDKSKSVGADEVSVIETIEDDNILDNEDESSYLDAAMKALDKGDNELASANILNAVQIIKTYVEEDEDSSDAAEAITQLTKFVDSIKSGTKVTSAEFQKVLHSLEFFSDDDSDSDSNDESEE